jgi:hypothetical protein
MRLAMIGEIEENGGENSGEDVDENSEESNDVADAVADGDIVADFEETVGDLAAVLSVERSRRMLTRSQKRRRSGRHLKTFVSNKSRHLIAHTISNSMSTTCLKLTKISRVHT